MALRLPHLHATVLTETGQQHQSLPQHPIPRVSVRIVQVLTLTGRPLFEQGCSWIFATKYSTQGSFEGAPKEHRRASVLFLPAVEVAMPIPPRAGQVLADLSEAVGHSGNLWTVQIRGRKFVPTARRSKAVESEQRRTVENDVADLDHAFEAYELGFVHLIASEQFSVVAEVAQEPVQLPQGFRIAIEPARKDVTGKSAGLKNSEAKGVVRLLRLASKEDSLNSNQKDSVGDLVSRITIGGVQTCNLTFHAAPSFWLG